MLFFANMISNNFVYQWNKLIWFLVFGITNQNIILTGQVLDCNLSMDSSRCYLEEKFIKPKIILEKKWESDIKSYNWQAAIVADMDNDCIPDLVVIADTGNKICILDSRTGKLKHYFNTIFLEISFSSLLVADINKDGIKEIIVVTLDNSINDIPYESRA